MLQTTKDANYSSRGIFTPRGMLVNTRDANYFTRKMLETSKNDNYSTGGWVQTT